MGHATRQIAEQMGAVLFELVLQPGLDEDELAERIDRRLAQLQPLISGVVERACASTCARSSAERGATTARPPTRLPGTRAMAVAFADLVGFTRLGEELAVDGARARRQPPACSSRTSSTRRCGFVKTIGDAAMLVSPDAGALLDALLDLIEAADAEGEDFPQLRVGVTYGPVLARGGDWFGRPVNLASRITALARAGSVLATRDVRDAAGATPQVQWSSGRRPARARRPRARVALPRAAAGSATDRRSLAGSALAARRAPGIGSPRRAVRAPFWVRR